MPNPLLDALSTASLPADQPPATDNPLLGALQGVAPAPAAPPPANKGSSFARGLEAGLLGIKETGYNLWGLGQHIFGDEQAARDTLEAAQRINQKENALAGAYDQDVMGLIHHGSFGDYLSFLGFNLGAQVPNIASVALSGGIGAVLGRKLAEVAGRRVIDEYAAQALARKFISRGAKAGAFLGASALETGSTVGEQYQATGGVDTGLALGAGAIKGGLEELTPLLLASKFGLGEAAGGALYRSIDRGLERAFGKGALGRLARGGLEALGTEATTEGLQEAVDVAAHHALDQNYKLFDENARNRILNAAATGGLVGLVFGGAAGALGGQHAGATAHQPAATQQQLASVFSGQTEGPNGAVAQTGQVGPGAVAAAATEIGPSSPGTQPIVAPPIAPPATAVSLQHLPATAGELMKTTTLTVPPAAQSFATTAIQLRNAADRMEAAGKPAAQVQQARAKAEAALNTAVQKGLAFAPTTAAPAATAPAAATPTPIAPAAAPTPTAAVAPAPAATPTPTTAAPIEVTPPDLLKAFPHGATPLQETMMQAMREQVTNEGGLAAMPEAARTYLLANPVKPNELGALANRMARLAEDDAKAVSPMIGGAPATVVSATAEPTASGIKMTVDMLDSAGNPVTKEQDLPADLVQKYAGRALSQLQETGYTALGREAAPKGRLSHLLRVTGRVAHQANGALIEAKVQARGLSLVDGAGNGRKIASMKPGDVLFVQRGLPSKELQRTFKKLMKEILPTEKLIVEYGTSSVLGPRATSGSYMDVVGYGYIRLAKTMDMQDLLTTAFHEFGHFIMAKRFQNANLATQTAIFQEWKNSIRNLPDDQKNLVFALGSPTRVLYEKPGKLSKEFLDWFDFDEYIAEQVTRWFYSREQPLSAIDKFMKGVATALKKAFAIFKAANPTATIEVNEAIGGWLDSLYKRRGAKGLDPMAAGQIEHSVDQAVEANANALGINKEQYSTEELRYVAPPGDRGTLNAEGAVRDALISRQAKAQVDKFNWWTKATWNLLQIADKNQHIAPLMQYVERTRAWSISRMQLISRADERLRRWHALGKDMGQNLANFLFEVDAMGYVPAGQNARWPTNQELIALAQKHKLNKAAADLYKDIKGDFLHVLDKVEAAWIADARRSIADPLELARQIASVQGEINALRARPYFPHARFGDFALQVRDGKGKLVFFQQFETQRAAQDAIAGARLQFPGHRIVMDKMPQEVRSFRGLPPAMLKTLKARLKLTPLQADWLDNFIFDLSPANSFAKKFKQRKGVAGFTMDAQRAYASYFLHGAGHLARLEHGQALQEGVDGIRQSRTALGDLALAEKDKRQRIADWTQRHLDYIMSGDTEWQALRSVAFQFYLGFAVDSALMNLTQVPLVAAPYLSARFGTVKGLNALRRNSFQLGKMRNLQTSSLAADKVAAISLGIEQGFLDEAQAAELAAVSEGNAMSRMLPGSSVQRAIKQMGYLSSFFFQTTEKLNRKLVFGAAYDLAKSNPKAPHIQQLIATNPELYAQLLSQGWRPENAAAFLAGRDAVERTQFEYAKWARPEFMRGKKGVLFTFYMFQQNMLWFLKNSPGGKKALLALLATAGISGLPGADDLDQLVTFLSERLFGTRFKPSEEMRRILVELTDRPDLIMHGLGRETLGMRWVGDAMGLPIPSIDLSSRIGMGRVIPGVQGFTAEGAQTFEERFGGFTKDVLGATFGIGLNIAKMLESGYNITDLKLWEGLLPRAAKNVARAYRYASQGQEVSRTGAQIVPFDLTDVKQRMELAGQMMGFTPTRLREKWDLISAEKNALAYWQMRRGELLFEFDRARQAKDREAMTSVRDAIRLYNQEVPVPKMRVSVKTILSSAKQRAVARKQQEANRGPLGRVMGQLYPETAATGSP